MTILNLVCLTQIKISNTPEKILKSSNPLQKFIDWGMFELYSDPDIVVNYVWGLEPELVNDPNLSRWKTPNKGHIQLND